MKQALHNVIVLHRATLARLLPKSIGFELAAQALKQTSLRRGAQPNRMSVPLADQGAALSAMAGVLHAPTLAGAKMSRVIPENRFRGLSGQGAVVLFASETGRVVALLHGGEITARRTPAATAVATCALALPGSRVLTLIGAGEQASHHLQALLECMPVTELRVLSRSPDRAQAWVASHSNAKATVGEIGEVLLGRKRAGSPTAKLPCSNRSASLQRI